MATRFRQGKLYQAMKVAKLEYAILQGLRLKLKNPLWHDADEMISRSMASLMFLKRYGGM